MSKEPRCVGHHRHKPSPTDTKRECLRCERVFVSVGKHNRVCDPCRAVNADKQEALRTFVAARVGQMLV